MTQVAIQKTTCQIQAPGQKAGHCLFGWMIQASVVRRLTCSSDSQGRCSGPMDCCGVQDRRGRRVNKGYLVNRGQRVSKVQQAHGGQMAHKVSLVQLVPQAHRVR